MAYEIESLLVSECDYYGSSIDSPDLAELHARSLRRSAESTRCISALRKFNELSAELGVRTCLFKGPALSNTVYENPQARPYNDLDVLVGRCEPQVLEEFFVRLGRSQESARALVSLSLSGRPVHEIHGSIDGADFDVHFNPFGLVTAVRSTDDLEGHKSKTIALARDAIASTVPSEELHLLIVLVNLCRRGGGALRFYADASRLLASATFDWSRFWDLAEREGLVTIANQALLSLKHDLGLDVDVAPDLSRAWWGPHIAERPTAERALRRPPLLALRLKPHLASDVASLLSWYVPGRVQRQARFG